LDGQLLISIAAGIRAQDLARWTGSQSIVRCMPNTPALIGSGITGLYALSGRQQELSKGRVMNICFIGGGNMA
ncbi:hypothetical protein OZK63_42505, partial [Streptomyces sp. UMAF16]|nr:hypothetical protein [Streptomyces sp. UMAF16]